MIIEFALIPFQRRLPSNAPITTLVTSDPAPVLCLSFAFSPPANGCLRVDWMAWRRSIRFSLELEWNRLKYPRVSVWLCIVGANKMLITNPHIYCMWQKGATLNLGECKDLELFGTYEMKTDRLLRGKHCSLNWASLLASIKRSMRSDAYRLQKNINTKCHQNERMVWNQHAPCSLSVAALYSRLERLFPA